MKKTMKKCLILAVVVMAMIVMALCVSAAGESYYCSECKELVTNTISGTIYPATCETDGYIEKLCYQAKVDADGKVMLDENGKIVRCLNLVGGEKGASALGHNEVETHVLAEAGTYYKHITVCSRKINDTPCGYKKVEQYDDKTPVKYYKVIYINPFVTTVTAPYCSYTSLAYIDLENDLDPATTCYTEKVLHTDFIKENTVSDYSAEPYRMPDILHGSYRFLGWAFETQSKYDPDNSKTPAFYAGFTVPVAGKNIADYKLYATFRGEYDTHTVTYYTEKGAKISEVEVAHGDNVSKAMNGATVPAAPLKADNIEYKFTFDYWTLFDIIGEFDQEQPIYADVKLKAHYTETLKKYQLKYFDRHGKALPNDRHDFVNIAGFGTIERLKADTGLAIKSNPTYYGLEASYFDAAFDYNFTGNWTIDGRSDAVIDIEHVTLPSDILDYDQTGSYIKVVPQYRKIARIYDLEVFVTYEDDGNWHPEEINVQVTDADGNPVGVSTLTEADIVKGTEGRNPTYKKVFKVKYSSSYHVAATSKNYKAERNPIFVVEAEGKNYDDYHVGGCTMLMTREAGEPCGCICHGIFKPVWVGILNILYNLFKAQFVCCDDMFANIGDSLVYGPSQS